VAVESLTALGVAFIEAARALEGAHRLVELLLLLQAQAKPIVRLRPLRRQVDRPLSVEQRRFDLADLEVGLAAIAEQHVVVRRRLDRLRVLEVRVAVVALTEGGIGAALEDGGTLFRREQPHVVLAALGEVLGGVWVVAIGFRWHVLLWETPAVRAAERVCVRRVLRHSLR